MKLKQTIKRKSVKAHRKVFGEDKEVMVTTAKGGLTKDEIEDVLATLRTATKREELPVLSYEHRRPTLIDRRVVLSLMPRTVAVATTRAKVRKVLRAAYGSKYIV